MVDISQHLKAIQNAKYGKEVRGSIHDALDTMNSAMDKLVGKKSKGENSAIFGSSSNKLEELELPDKIYYKPIAEEYYYIKVTGEPVFTTQAGQEVSNMGSWACLVEYNVLYNGEIYAVAENKIYKVNVESNSVFIELEAPTDVTYYNKSDIPVPDGTEIKFYETEPKIRYKFENLTFTTDGNGTLLEKLYTYTDNWNNRFYTVYEDYTPNIADNGEIQEVPEDDKMLKGLKYEALFNSGTYFAVAEGDNSFSAGEDSVSYADGTFSVGYINLVLADGSTALGRRLLVRGVGANGFGLNGKSTGRYAVSFNEAGEAIGWATFVIGNHCGAYDDFDFAGGTKTKNYAHTTFLYGKECVADKGVYYSFGGGDKIRIYKGYDNFLWGKELEASGNYNGVLGASNTVEGNNNLIGGNNNFVGSSSNLVGGVNHQIEDYDKVANGTSVIAGSNNTINGGWAITLLGSHLRNITGNQAFLTGLKNESSGNYNVVGGAYNNSNGSYSVLLGVHLASLKGYNVLLGSYLTAEQAYSNLLGDHLTATGWFKTILGRYNAPSSNPFVVAYGSSDSDRKNIFEVTASGKAISKEVETDAIILKAPNGSKFKVTVNNNGELVTEGV